MDTSAFVNLDYAASTPMRESAKQAQIQYDESELAGVNPNSLHSLGRKASAQLESCRRVIAQSFGSHVRSSEIVFTSGGTESNVLALAGLARAVRASDPKRNRVILSAIEHDSILDNAALLREFGFVIDTVKPCKDGYIEPSALEELMDTDVALVSIMFANNETGVIQPIKELCQIAHNHGSRFHTDAVQGWLHSPFDVQDLEVDAASVAGHKVGGPVGIGVLYLKNRTALRPLAQGGGQELGLRPGTQDLRAIVALAAVVEELLPSLESTHDRLVHLTNNLYETICVHPRIFPSVKDWASVQKLPGIINLYVQGMDSEELILQLDGRSFEVSAASACSSGNLDASHVLTAMGIPKKDALGSLRISFDDRVSADDLDRFTRALFDVVG